MFNLLLSNNNNVIENITDLMIIAINNESIKIIQQLILSQSSIHIYDRILINHASRQNNLDIFNIVYKLNYDKAEFSVDNKENNINEEYKHDENIKLYEDNLILNTKNLTHKDSNGECPLHYSIIRGTIIITKKLIELHNKNGISIDLKTNNGITPFHLACLKQDKELCNILYNNGANVNETDNLGNSICHLISATSSGLFNNIEWLDYLINKYNLNCFLKNNKGNTPFFTAILTQNIDLVNYYLKIIPNINWKNKLGQTCLHTAVFSQDINILEDILYKCMPDISIEDISGLTAYHYAAMESNENILHVFNKYIEHKNKVKN